MSKTQGDSQHLPWLNGVELLHDAWEKRYLPTGCEGIDNLLGGGLREGQLTELVGASSSGKTQVCLNCASCTADMQLGSVLFLDTCNSFSANRISCIVSQKSDHLCKEGEERKLRMNMIMSNIMCKSVFDIFELLDALNQLEDTLKQQLNAGCKRTCLLIIDSISSLISPILGGKGSQGRSLMVSTGILLKKLANQYNLSVLVTNHMVGGDGRVLKPALGESWKSIPHARVLLSRDRAVNICNITVLKHTIVASGHTAKFVIHN